MALMLPDPSIRSRHRLWEPPGGNSHRDRCAWAGTILQPAPSREDVMHAPISPHEARRVIGDHMIVRDHFDFVMDLERSHGSYIVDARDTVRTPDGHERRLDLNERTLLDFYTQFAAWPVAYNHPDLTRDEAFLKVLNRVAVHKIANSDVVTVEKAAYVKIMSEMAMQDGLDYLFIISGGALAVENALKAAFDWKVRLNFSHGIMFPDHEYKVAHFREAFHGRTGYTMTLTNTDPDKVRFFPKLTDWPRISNPKITFPLEQNLEQVERLEAQAIGELEASIRQNPHTIAAVIIETIQGEGGDNHFRPEFFQKLRTLTEAHDILFVLDEVQTGCGLTGKFWAYQHMGVVPDIISFGKKMQVCGILANRAKFDRIDENVFKMAGRLNSTWGADLVDMVRATRLLEIIRDHRLVDNAATVGAHLLEGLYDLQRQFPDMITNARGRGLMCAFDFRNPSLRSSFIGEMRRNRVLTLTCGAASIRLRPMLDIDQTHVQAYLNAAARSLQAIRR